MFLTGGKLQRSVYLATNIAGLLSEIVAVSVRGKNGFIGIPLASLLPAASATDTLHAISCEQR
jgi:hypothetical protein